jgi:AcrR family transcriptional regulator
VPKPTFFNLPPDRRDALVELAVAEFAEQPYRAASVSRVVSRAGVAKGSMYQYFANKRDLYAWLVVEECERRRVAYVGDALRPVEWPVAGAGASSAAWDPWTALTAHVHGAVRFVAEAPAFARLRVRLTDGDDDPETADLRRVVLEREWRELQGWLERSTAAGAIAPIDEPGVCAQLIATLLGPGVLAMLRRHDAFAAASGRGSGHDHVDRLCQTLLRFLDGALGRRGSSPSAAPAGSVAARARPPSGPHA